MCSKMYSGVLKSRRVNASIAMGSAFFGNADSSYRSGNARRAVGAVSTTDYDRQSDVAPAYARWVRLRIRRANFLPCGHSSRCTLTDTALIACTHAMVQRWYGYVVCSRRVPEHSLLQVGLWTLRALGSYSHFGMAPPNRRLHEEGHQAASCEAHRKKEHWRDRASGRIADPRDDVLRDEAAKVAH